MKNPSYNRVTLVGVVGSCRLDRFDNGHYAYHFSLGTQRFVFHEGKTVSGMDWHWLTIWGDNSAIAAGKELLRGRIAVIEGHLRYTTVKDDDGKFKQRYTDIIVDYYRVLGGDNDEDVPNLPGRVLSIDPEKEAVAEAAASRFDQILATKRGDL